jgi:P pilus assembly chaperone PapD
MRWLASTMIVSALGLMTAAMPASAQVTVDSLVYTIETVDGVAGRTIPVRNETAWPMVVRVEMGDWEVDAEGRHRFLPMGSVESSCAGRLAAEPRSITIEPFTTGGVRLAYRGGADDRCQNIVFLQTDDAGTADATGEDIALIIKMGIKIYVRP